MLGSVRSRWFFVVLFFTRVTGAFGVVYEGLYSNNKVAVKTLKCETQIMLLSVLF